MQTVDFFTPVVDDPCAFGAIAAANALSDVYAMGGRPITALVDRGFPEAGLPREWAARDRARGRREAARGGLRAARRPHGARPRDQVRLRGDRHRRPGAHPHQRGRPRGQALVLTKPLGTGVIATALKAGAGARGGRRRLDALDDDAQPRGRRGRARPRRHRPRRTSPASGSPATPTRSRARAGSRSRSSCEALPLLPGALELAERFQAGGPQDEPAEPSSPGSSTAAARRRPAARSSTTRRPPAASCCWCRRPRWRASSRRSRAPASWPGACRGAAAARRAGLSRLASLTLFAGRGILPRLRRGAPESSGGPASPHHGRETESHPRHRVRGRAPHVEGRRVSGAPRALARRYARALLDVASAPGTRRRARPAGRAARLRGPRRRPRRAPAGPAPPGAGRRAEAARPLRAWRSGPGRARSCVGWSSCSPPATAWPSLSDVAEAYAELANAAQGVVSAEAVSAVVLPDAAEPGARGRPGGRRRAAGAGGPAVLGGVLVLRVAAGPTTGPFAHDSRTCGGGWRRARASARAS